MIKFEGIFKDFEKDDRFLGRHIVDYRPGPKPCSGTLVLKIDGVERTMPTYYMCSGGSVWFDSDCGEYVESGRWSVDVPDDLIELKDEIEECVNANVSHECCGGFV